jgi:hypothetical protein
MGYIYIHKKRNQIYNKTIQKLKLEQAFRTNKIIRDHLLSQQQKECKYNKAGVY